MGEWLGPAVTAAVISSLIAAIGWYVSWRTANGLERRRRRERVRDVQTALLAEIRSMVFHLGQYDPAQVMVGARSQLSADPAHTPFVPREPGAPLYEAVVKEISILPNAVIDPVVLFYRQQNVIAQFAEDLRSERFQQLKAEQKLAMIEDYLALRGYAAALGRDAMLALDPRSSALASRSAADPSAQQSASDVEASSRS
ncbi:hypothetical protein [Mangrovibrevibacter kandeliae]|uniref:hypothetical protein n=1 Tax=Mangrovibrevibacter kandeliae TaxID=2968473 RepID=UPI002118469C|nr:hypothetical protein [Aurantimonas sp. CSK15Z-1]MCQ8780966.1 hypothetical protein [Aurantimonas sp. CSK15Z-1]